MERLAPVTNVLHCEARINAAMALSNIDKPVVAREVLLPVLDVCRQFFGEYSQQYEVQFGRREN